MDQIIVYIIFVASSCNQKSYGSAERQDILDALVQRRITATNKGIRVRNNSTFEGAFLDQLVRDRKMAQNTFQKIALNSLIPNNEVSASRKALQGFSRILMDVRLNEMKAIDDERRRVGNLRIDASMPNCGCAGSKLF